MLAVCDEQHETRTMKLSGAADKILTAYSPEVMSADLEDSFRYHASCHWPCLEVDDQLELGWLLDGQVGWLRSLQYFVHETGSISEHFGSLQFVLAE
jgi:hypothetical protein